MARRMSPRVCSSPSPDSRPRARLVHRRQHPGAVQVGVKQYAAGATRHLRDRGVQCRGVQPAGIEIAPKPVPGQGAGLVGHGTRPAVRWNQKAQPHPRRLPNRALGHHAVQARRAKDGARLPRRHHSAAHQRRRHVRQSGHHRRTGGHAAVHGRGLGHLPGHRAGGQHRRQQGVQLPEPPLLQQARRERTLSGIAGSMAGVGGRLAGEAEADPVLGEQEGVRAFQHRRLAVAQPAHHHQREPRRKRVAGSREAAFEQSGRTQLIQHRNRARIVPRDGVAHRATVPIHQPRPAHERADADGPNRMAAAKPTGELAQGGRDLPPQPLHLHLDPARPRGLAHRRSLHQGATRPT